MKFKPLSKQEKQEVVKALLNIDFNATETTIDLSACKENDLLITSRGGIVRYVKAIDPEVYYFDHEIIYSNGSRGTRTNDGYVFRKNRLDTDANIVKIVRI